MSRLAWGLAVAAIFAVARGDLNAADFISRGVEGNGKYVENQALGWSA
jgi:hypothetical protein